MIKLIIFFQRDTLMGILQFRKVTQSVENSPFDCGVESINYYVRHSYYPLIIQQAYAYSVASKDKVLGYYQVLFRDIELDKFPEHIAEYRFDDHYLKLTALHIRYIAIDKKYQRLGIGTSVMRTIIKNCRELADVWPVRVITLDANVNLVRWYSGFDFRKTLSNTAGQDGVTTMMFLDCMRYSAELEEYVS